jgi:excisionase family DNA binding protein
MYVTPLAYHASEAQALLNVSKPTLMQLFKSGRLNGCRIGEGRRGHLLISRASLLRLVGENPDAG